MKMNFNCSDKMRIKKNTEFGKILRFAMTHPLNVVIIGESGVGKEYFARVLYDKRVWTNNFITFDWECENLCQFQLLEDLTRNHLTAIADVRN